MADLNLEVISTDMDLHDSAGNTQQNVPVYVIDEISFGGFTVRRLSITETKYPVIILGRDILNDYVATFDGPGQRFTLTEP